MKQRTINDQIIFKGIGVHSGAQVKIVLKPALQDTGIIFVNSNNTEQTIKIGQVIPEVAMHASVIKNNNFVISTTEHLLATINAFFIDNLIIEITGPELPILDGSAFSFVHEIERVGIKELNKDKKFLTPKNILKFEDNKGRSLEILPALNGDNNLYFDYIAEFSHPLIGQSKISGILTTDFFVKEIAPARTFGFLEQLPFLKQHGLAKGTTLGNTVVIGQEELLNETRFEDEFVRHKLLDLIGDIALLGKNLVGTIKAVKTGHSFNRLITENYIKNPENWDIF